MPKFPVNAPIREVVSALERLGFHLVREGKHIAIVPENPDGTRTPLTVPQEEASMSIKRLHCGAASRTREPQCSVDLGGMFVVDK